MAVTAFPPGWYANNFFKARFIDGLEPIRDLEYPRAQ